jgi:hypothetical protein
LLLRLTATKPPAMSTRLQLNRNNLVRPHRLKKQVRTDPSSMASAARASGAHDRHVSPDCGYEFNFEPTLDPACGALPVLAKTHKAVTMFSQSCPNALEDDLLNISLGHDDSWLD